MSDNVNVLLVGTGYMGVEYAKVLKDLKCKPVAVCRRKESAESFEKETGIRTFFGGVDSVFDSIDDIPGFAIVAVGVEDLAEVTLNLLGRGIKHILVEKPGAVFRKDFDDIISLLNDETSVYVAYNRRFYQATQKALEYINKDGGVTSFHFEFTEWNSVWDATKTILGKENMLLCNSSHVIDLAFFLGGLPVDLCAYQSGTNEWHKYGTRFYGAGLATGNVPFSYQADWDAPGRWAVEVMTREHRLIMKPMEKLYVQNHGSVEIHEQKLENDLDDRYKPGLYEQVSFFLEEKEDSRFLSIRDQLLHLDYYDMILGRENEFR